MAVPAIRFPIFIVIRLLGVVVATLLLAWTMHYRGGLALISDNKDLIFNVHPVLMVIGLVLMNGEAMLAYKTVPGTKAFKKLVHLTLQFLAFSLSLIGVWAALKFHNDKGIDNFYSLHSWLGLACLSLFGIQVFLICSFPVQPKLHCFPPSYSVSHDISLFYSGLLDLQPFGTQVAQKIAEPPCCHGMYSLESTFMRWPLLLLLQVS
uniref:Putative transmembrane ascorbate ferrireductase 2 n=1 Tax=Rhizophora mucronata TaxID=61149 RepID=A0A2P2JXV4_RHIMU